MYPIFRLQDNLRDGNGHFCWVRQDFKAKQGQCKSYFDLVHGKLLPNTIPEEKETVKVPIDNIIFTSKLQYILASIPLASWWPTLNLVSLQPYSMGIHTYCYEQTSYASHIAMFWTLQCTIMCSLEEQNPPYFI